MHKLNPRSLAALAALTLLGLTGSALAGQKASWPVSVSTASRIASGAMSSARNSADTSQRLECWSLAAAAGGSYASCYARDAAGLSASCYTFNADLMATVRALHGDDLVSFTYDTSGQCQSVQVVHSSIVEPKL